MLRTVASPGTFGCHDRRFFYRCTEVTDTKADTHYGLWFTLPTRLSRFCASEGRKRVTSLQWQVFLPLCAFHLFFALTSKPGLDQQLAATPPTTLRPCYKLFKKKKKNQPDSCQPQSHTFLSLQKEKDGRRDFFFLSLFFANIMIVT